MIRVAMSGVGDIKHHFQGILKMPEKEFSGHINQISKILSDSHSEILLTPSRGVCLEVAKKYKQFGGKKVYAAAPLNDKVFGTKHFKENLNIRISHRRLFDKIIDTKTWEKQHFAFGLFGHALLILGASLGTFYELSSAFYVYKIISGNKPEVKVIKRKIHKDIVAGDDFPLTLIIYRPFMSKLPMELEHYIKKSGGLIFYADSPENLKDILNRLNSYAKK